MTARGEPPPRGFSPPWTIDEANAACFIVRDSTGQAIAYVYFEHEPGRRSAAKLLTRARATHRGQYRQAAGAIAEALETSEAEIGAALRPLSAKSPKSTSVQALRLRSDRVDVRDWPNQVKKIKPQGRGRNSRSVLHFRETSAHTLYI